MPQQNRPRSQQRRKAQPAWLASAPGQQISAASRPQAAKLPCFPTRSHTNPQRFESHGVLRTHRGTVLPGWVGCLTVCRSATSAACTRGAGGRWSPWRAWRTKAITYHPSALEAHIDHSRKPTSAVTACQPVRRSNWVSAEKWQRWCALVTRCHAVTSGVLRVSCASAQPSVARDGMDAGSCSTVQDFGARDPTAGELGTGFGNKQFGNADTDHIKRCVFAQKMFARARGMPALSRVEVLAMHYVSTCASMKLHCPSPDCRMRHSML